MNFVRFIYDDRDYRYDDSNSLRMCILGRFLSSDVRGDVSVYKDWVLNDSYKTACGNITILDKVGHDISLGDLFSEEKVPTKLIMTVEQFIQLLDDWQEKACKKCPKNVLIKHEYDQFIIETSE